MGSLPSRSSNQILMKEITCDKFEFSVPPLQWSDFTPAELMNFLRILEKEEAEYRNAIYYQYGLVRQQIEQRMAQLSAQDRLSAVRHSVATCSPAEQLCSSPCHPQRSGVSSRDFKSQRQHASL